MASAFAGIGKVVSANNEEEEEEEEELLVVMVNSKNPAKEGELGVTTEGRT